MLCRFCNIGLGYFQDDPARIGAAIAYLKRTLNLTETPIAVISKRSLARWKRLGISNTHLIPQLQAQELSCAICQADTLLHVDHDHATGTLRGMLCPSCNIGLGHFRDSSIVLGAARLYLEVAYAKQRLQF